MDSPHVLVIEDEESILELIRYNLLKEGYRVTTATSGEFGLRQARDLHPDLVVLDLMLPGMDGLEVCRVLKSAPETSTLPVVMISARGEEKDIVRGLELGADDYVTKPFSPKVLAARVNAVLRRGPRDKRLGEQEVIEIHGITIDPVRFQVYLAETPLALTFTEFKVLHFLARHPGWVFTRYQIVDAVRGEDYAVTERAVDVQIVGLRKKLGELGALVETVRGVGYRFKE